MVRGTEKGVTWMVVILLVVVYCLPIHVTGFSGSAPWYSRFTYQWGHTSLWHLLVNVNALLCLPRTSKKRYLAAFLVSSPLFLFGTLPTLGFSGVIFALCGFIVGSSNRLLYGNLYFILAFLVSYAIYRWLGMSNIYLHVYCFYLAQIIYLCKRKLAKS